MSNVSTVAAMYEAVGRGDLESFLANLDDDCVWENPGPAHLHGYFGVKRGPREVRGVFEFVAAQLGVTTFRPERMFEDGDAVIAVVAVEGTVPSTGKSWGGRAAQQFTFGPDGKVVAFRDYQDSWAVAAALEPDPR